MQEFLGRGRRENTESTNRVLEGWGLIGRALDSEMLRNGEKEEKHRVVQCPWGARDDPYWDRGRLVDDDEVTVDGDDLDQGEDAHGDLVSEKGAGRGDAKYREFLYLACPDFPRVISFLGRGKKM